MLSSLSRGLTALAGMVFAALGAAMFVAPHWAAREFAWSVSPFLAMTVGAWYLGSAVFAFECVRMGRLATMYGGLLYFWLFAVLEALVVVVHADDLDSGNVLTWPYVVALSVAVLATAAGAVDWARARPSLNESGPRNPTVFRVLAGAFAVAVLLLALPLLDGYDNPPSIWPGPLTLESARSFAAFFGSLALSTVPLVFTRHLAPVLAYLRSGIVLNVLILVAALVFIGRFDFGGHPGQLLYVGLYLFVLAGAVTMLLTGRRRAGTAALGEPSLR